ncbi:hypothetical protein ACK8P5_19140 [Paenibacillus sp. EC2-1]|uniref:hypothetical protein n=1 Tax=Paenibacillus sp. EC2-1 TaxID=3388665 RepID=UPI003BEEDF4A
MEQTKLPMKLHELRSGIDAELEQLSEDEQALILQRFLQRIQKYRTTGSHFENIRQVFSPPYLWLLIGGGIVLPILLYIVIIWSSLQLEG